MLFQDASAKNEVGGIDGCWQVVPIAWRSGNHAKEWERLGNRKIATHSDEKGELIQLQKGNERGELSISNLEIG